MNYTKYKKLYFPVKLSHRKWPDNEICKAPDWCSVDLRDGNQSLIAPMKLDDKIALFNLLVSMGFKQIEVGFPAASDTEYMFIRTLIEQNMIPDDVYIQVLTQIRPDIINKTFMSIAGAKNVILHMYNSTSEIQRRMVFGMDKSEVKNLAVSGAEIIHKKFEGFDGNIIFEYSPETFIETEPEFALDICNAVLDVFEPTADKKVIINLPSTVEISTPNIYADQIEFMSENLKYRDNVVLSVHTHNDRGGAVASSELALLAGAQRIEGTLFGNGERTGNADIITIALNMYSQGVDPKLEIENIDKIINAFETLTHMYIHPRHPYAGELVYTAFSGSHQDAIKKAMDYVQNNNINNWENPYLTIDPSDLGRKYEPIRINSQSGRGGLMFILQNKFGLVLPKDMAGEFSALITDISDKDKTEISADVLYNLFIKYFVNIERPIKFIDYSVVSSEGQTKLTAKIEINGEINNFIETGNGPLDAFCKIIGKQILNSFEIAQYNEHALEQGSSSSAIAYVCIKYKEQKIWGAGTDTNISAASIKALLSAVNRAMVKENE